MLDSAQAVPDAAGVLAEVIRLVALEIPDGPPVTARSDLFRDLALDSMNVVNLAAALEDVFGVELTEEDASTVCTVGDLAAVVLRLLERRP